MSLPMQGYPFMGRAPGEAPPPPPRETGEELARIRKPLTDRHLRGFSRWVRTAYGEDVMVLGDGDWLTVYRQPR